MKRTTGLLAMVLVLAGAALWIDRSCAGTDDLLRARTRLYPAFDRTRIASISVGTQALSSGPRYEALAAELAFAQLDRRIASPDGRQRRAFGLDPPRATFTVQQTDGSARVFALGAELPGGRSRYLARSGETDVFVVERKLFDLLAAVDDVGDGGAP
jgi:hypothetical protein